MQNDDYRLNKAINELVADTEKSEKIDHDAATRKISEAISAFTTDVAEDWEVSKTVATQWTNKYIVTLNDIKRGNYFVYGYSTLGDLTAERQEAVKFWIDTIFFRRDLPVVVRARNGRGKTYFLSWLLLRTTIMRPDADILTNIPFYWLTDIRAKPLKVPNFYKINKMSQMLRLSAQSVLNDRIPYVIIDEMDNAVSSQDYKGGKESPYASWKEFTYIKRHLLIKGPILAYHSVNDIPNYMRSRQIVADIFKIFVHGPDRYIFSDATKPYSLKIAGDILLYSKHGFNDFAIDVMMRKLRVSIGETNTPKETAKKILENLDANTFDVYGENKTNEEKAEKYRAICALHEEEPQLTYRQIADRLGLKTISGIKEALDWCKEQKNNKENGQDYGEGEENE